MFSMFPFLQSISPVGSMRSMELLKAAFSLQIALSRLLQ
jgi:hypothetical protein